MYINMEDGVVAIIFNFLRIIQPCLHILPTMFHFFEAGPS